VLDWSARPLSDRRTPLVAVTTVLAASVMFAACQGSGTPPAPSVAAAPSVANPAAASETAVTVSGANTALVCHLNDTGAFVPLFVKPQAVPAHLVTGTVKWEVLCPVNPTTCLRRTASRRRQHVRATCCSTKRVAAWIGAKGALHAGYTFFPPDNANCDSNLDSSNPSDNLLLSAHRFAAAWDVCYAYARVGGTFLVNTFIPANAAERTACIASVQSRCTPYGAETPVRDNEENSRVGGTLRPVQPVPHPRLTHESNRGGASRLPPVELSWQPLHPGNSRAVRRSTFSDVGPSAHRSHPWHVRSPPPRECSVAPTA
jgi:hypothetical protein